MPRPTGTTLDPRRFFATACLSAALVLATASAASAVTIGVQVIDATTISVSLSGTIVGPTPDSGLGILFIDTPVPSSIRSSSSSITGDALVGALAIGSSFSGYNNGDYAGSLQLRTGPPPIATWLTGGELLSGTATISYDVPHGMTQSMFDGPGLPGYWGSNNFGATNGTLQGVAVTLVPEPGTGLLIGLGLLVMGVPSRKRALARLGSRGRAIG